MDDLQLTPRDPEQTQLKAGGAWLPWTLGAVLLVAIAFGVWWFLRQNPPPPPIAAPAPAPTAAPVAQEATPAVGPQTDAQFQEWIAKIWSAPDAGWFAGGDLARRVAGAVFATSRGEDPRPFLRPFAPAKHFRVLTRHGKSVIDPATYARFGGAMKAISTMNVAPAAEAWKALHPLLAAAWKEIAPPSTNIDTALDQAIGNLLAVPVPDGQIAVRPKGVNYVFVDPKLEALSPAQKIVLRLGPANARVLQAKARELAQALGLPSAGK